MPNIPVDIISDGDEQQQELENIINDLEEENMYLMEEYTRLQSQLNTASATNTIKRNYHTNSSMRSNTSTLPLASHKNQFSDMINSKYHYGNSEQHLLPQSNYMGKNLKSNESINKSSSLLINSQSDYNKMPKLFTTLNSGLQSEQIPGNKVLNKEKQILAEARLLRQHEDRLEARMKILENHNRLLDSQLKQLRNLLNNVISLFILFHFFNLFLYNDLNFFSLMLKIQNIQSIQQFRLAKVQNEKIQVNIF